MSTNNEITTLDELGTYGIVAITEAVMPLLSTVTVRDNICECWIDFVDNAGDFVRLEPDKTGWQDGRKEIVAHKNGRNIQIFISKDSPLNMPHNITWKNGTAMDTYWNIPTAILNWAVERAV